MLTLDLQIPPQACGEGGQLIKPGLMALTPAHNPEEESWRKKGQSLHNISQPEWLRGAGLLAGFHLCIDFQTVTQDLTQEVSPIENVLTSALRANQV